jgi:hypothetical protein
VLPPLPCRRQAEGAVASKKPAAQSTARFDARTAAQLERRSRSIGAPVDDAAIDRILATVDLADTTAILAPGVDAAKFDAATSAEIKRMRWGGEIRSMLSFLTAMVRRRKLNTPQASRKMAKLAKALCEAKTVLKNDHANEAALALAEMALDRLQENMKGARDWTNERIAGEFLPAQYWTFTKRPKMTRPKMTRPRLAGGAVQVGETLKFIQAVLNELGIEYERETIIRAMQDAKKPKRHR